MGLTSGQEQDLEIYKIEAILRSIHSIPQITCKDTVDFKSEYNILSLDGLGI